MIGGQFAVFICLILLIVFERLNVSSMLLVMLYVYVIAFQGGFGSLFFTHAAETTVDAANGLANLSHFSWMLITSLMTPTLIDNAGLSGTFGLYAAICFIGVIYMYCCLRETIYSDEVIEEIDGVKSFRRLTEKEKKQLYMPSELREESK